MNFFVFLLLLKSNLIPDLKTVLEPLACSYLKNGDVDVREILIVLRKNGNFYTRIVPYMLSVKGDVEEFEIPEDFMKEIEENGDFYASGECRLKDERAYLFLSFRTPYKIEKMGGKEINLRKISKIKKVKIIKEMENESCEYEKIFAQESLSLKFGKGVRKVELADAETDEPFIIIPFSEPLFPEIPDAPQSKSIEERLLILINEERKMRNLKELIYSKEISRVSRKHSEDMAKNGFLSHFSPSTGSPSDRMKKAGINFSKVSENIGLGKSADEIHLMLMDSSAHKCNIIDPEMEKVGIGAYFYNDMWWVTENFIKEKKP